MQTKEKPGGGEARSGRQDNYFYDAPTPLECQEFLMRAINALKAKDLWPGRGGLYE